MGVTVSSGVCLLWSWNWLPLARMAQGHGLYILWSIFSLQSTISPCFLGPTLILSGFVHPSRFDSLFCSSTPSGLPHVAQTLGYSPLHRDPSCKVSQEILKLHFGPSLEAVETFRSIPRKESWGIYRGITLQNVLPPYMPVISGDPN